MAALHDLNVGRVVAMVTPKSGFDNRKPEASFRKVIRAFATFSIEQLKSRGMTLDEACKFVAKQLERAQVPIGGKSNTASWKTIKTWRYDVTRRDPSDQEQHTLEALRVKFSFPQDMALQQVKKQLAQMLSAMLPKIQAALG
jgi:hypothetical protein